MPKVTNHHWMLEDTHVNCSATALPPVPARGPTYSCAGEPPEGGYAEDLAVWLEHPDNPERKLDITEWVTKREQEAILEDLYACWETDRADAAAYAEEQALEAWRESLEHKT